jgi:hypothetical protein
VPPQVQYSTTPTSPTLATAAVTVTAAAHVDVAGNIIADPMQTPQSKRRRHSTPTAIYDDVAGDSIAPRPTFAMAANSVALNVTPATTGTAASATPRLRRACIDSRKKKNRTFQ